MASDSDFQQSLWKAADKLRAQMDAAGYKHIVIAPDMIAILRTQPNARSVIQPEPPLLRLLLLERMSEKETWHVSPGLTTSFLLLERSREADRSKPGPGLTSSFLLLEPPLCNTL